jgi:CDP-diacylglycerol pyrophosphatase
LGHDYLGRRVTPAELEQQGAFRLLASGLPRADGRMGSFGLAMTALPDGDFLLLAPARRLLPFTLASAEEIQDHDCRLLTPPPRA